MEQTAAARERCLRLASSNEERALCLNVSVAAVCDERLPQGRVLVLEDLTSCRVLERTVAHQNRLASIGRWAGVAHEIGNPSPGC